MAPSRIKRLLRLMRDPERLERDEDARCLRAALRAPSAHAALLQVLDRAIGTHSPELRHILHRIDVLGEGVPAVAASLGRSRRQVFRLRADALRRTALAAAMCLDDGSVTRQFSANATASLLARALAADASGDITACAVLVGIAERRFAASGRSVDDATLFLLQEARFMMSRRHGDVRAARTGVNAMDRLSGKDPSRCVRAALYRAELAVVFNEPDVAECMMREASRFTETRDDPRTFATLIFTRAQYAFARGDFSEAATEALAAVQLIRRFHRGYAMRAAALASRAALLAGWEWESPLILARDASWYATDTLAVEARYALRDGDLATAQLAAARAVRVAGGGHPPLLAYALATHAAVASASRDARLAAQLQSEAVRLDAAMPHAVIRRDIWRTPIPGG